jgi:hypothetical protein
MHSASSSGQQSDPISNQLTAQHLSDGSSIP